MADVVYAFGGLEKLPPNITSFAPIITKTVVNFINTPVTTAIIPTITAIITTTIVKNCSDVSISCEQESAPRAKASSRSFFARPFDGLAIWDVVLLVGCGGIILIWMIVATFNDCRRYLESKRSKEKDRQSV
ncbi:uncharacterized protein Bfra_000065 [Botrytis fragariae]|uniref:Uncharacterized protein n=1 Tax=Botrytis fragariae TaxID=1964551 RepID=A0A8H6B2M1_9HELO|nr:uncharacterized protein Bfra_000065 [Botrytis fragariae]KAF5877902.1 hypothetical protein Bfra_000065 [Botrytis fragariae]